MKKIIPIMLVLTVLVGISIFGYKYYKDNSYDSNKNISRHIRFAKRDFVQFMISVVFFIKDHKEPFTQQVPLS